MSKVPRIARMPVLLLQVRQNSRRKGPIRKPRSANLESEDSNSNTTGDPSIDDGLGIPPAEHPYAEAVRVHGAFVPAVASKSTKLKATSIDHRNQKVANRLRHIAVRNHGCSDRGSRTVLRV